MLSANVAFNAAPFDYKPATASPTSSVLAEQKLFLSAVNRLGSTGGGLLHPHLQVELRETFSQLAAALVTSPTCHWVVVPQARAPATWAPVDGIAPVLQALSK